MPRAVAAGGRGCVARRAEAAGTGSGPVPPVSSLLSDLTGIHTGKLTVTLYKDVAET